MNFLPTCWGGTRSCHWLAVHMCLHMRGRVCVVAPPVHRRTGRQHAGIRGGLAGLQMGENFDISLADHCCRSFISSIQIQSRAKLLIRIYVTRPGNIEVWRRFWLPRLNYRKAFHQGGTELSWKGTLCGDTLTCIGRLLAMVKLGMGGSAL